MHLLDVNFAFAQLVYFLLFFRVEFAFDLSTMGFLSSVCNTIWGFSFLSERVLLCV